MSPRVRPYIVTLAVIVPLGLLGCGAGGPPPTKTPDVAVAPAAAPPTVDRDVIHTASLAVQVADLDKARGEVDRLMTTYGGFVAKAEVRNTPGTRRSAAYTLRVPADGFAAAVDELAALGTPDHSSSDSDDVTDAVADAAAHLARLREQGPEREPGGDWVLAGRRATAAKGDPRTAQAERHLKALAGRAALASIALELREAREYVPANAPSFGTRVRQAAADSWGGFFGLMEGVVVVAVVLSPWLLIAAPVGVWVVRVRRRKRAPIVVAVAPAADPAARSPA